MTQRKTHEDVVIVASRPVSAGMRRYVPAGAFVIAADAGWQHAAALGLKVHLAVGDFDSAAPPPPGAAKKVVRLPAEKDDTDTHYAARQAILHGARRVVLLGSLGGRADHTAANWQTLLWLAQHGAQALAATDGYQVYCIGPKTPLTLTRGPGEPGMIDAPGAVGAGPAAAYSPATGQGQPPGQTPAGLPAPGRTPAPGGPPWLSVFAAGGPAHGVREAGVKYPLHGVTLTPDTPLGTSNEFAAPTARISCEAGYLYVVVSH